MAMSRLTVLRAKAFLLATVFFVGGFGVPGLDIVLHHLGGTRDPVEINQPHFDPLGGCNSHAEHCLVIGLRPATQVSAPLVTPLLACASTSDLTTPEPNSADPTFHAGALPPSRGPPPLV
jgi:hypothetical protein